MKLFITDDEGLLSEAIIPPKRLYLYSCLAQIFTRFYSNNARLRNGSGILMNLVIHFCATIYTQGQRCVQLRIETKNFYGG